MQPSVTVFGLQIDNVSITQASTLLADAAADKSHLTPVAFVNADCMNIAWQDEAYKTLLQSRDFVFGDGSGIRYACRFTGQQIHDNVNGTDLFPLLCEQALARGQSIYLLGGKPGVAQRAAERSCRRYAGLQIAGSQHGYFADDETPAVVAAINASGADILIVGLGAPRQERWIEAQRQQLTVGVAIGVGGLLDFVAREVSRAPGWVRKIGFEWVVRFLNEPVRLLRRYFLGNPLFLYRVLRQRIKMGKPVPAVASVVPDADAPAAKASRFDIWRDFEVLDRVESKYEQQLGRHGRSQFALRQWQRRWAFVRLTRSYRVVKRGIDVVTAGLGMVVLAPLFLATMAAIYVNDPGPVFYSQIRVGFRGRTFRMLKFRSMVVDAERRRAELLASNESAAGVLFKMKRDPRITAVGAFIRRFSIDELPQLLNVLRGDMTLVGPRPPLPSEVDLYSLADRRRLEAVPGITCLWQVSGRSDIDFIGQVKLDVDYIENQGTAQDLRILLRTVPAVLGGKGAY
ncbi:MAG: WecB/TagA/CpsF family glycosyltransferase [Pseudomonadales bacterium]|nr:WecB/TagA/CpsF family glycosyltransferase [Pseudomonadales bacterium]MDP4640865.1 WecB/TagA/CpsF family glycosyltransferase [Pseudomonadales bacterium]